MTEKYVVEYKEGGVITAVGNAIQVLVRDTVLTIITDYKGQLDMKKVILDFVDEVKIRNQ